MHPDNHTIGGAVESRLHPFFDLLQGDGLRDERGEVQTNNPKTSRPRRSLLRRLLSPLPHGVSQTHLEEFRAFARKRWERMLAEAGLELLAVRKGPVCSGYGFGLDRLRRLLEWVGLTSEYVYIARAGESASPWEAGLAQD